MVELRLSPGMAGIWPLRRVGTSVLCHPSCAREGNHVGVIWPGAAVEGSLYR